MLKIDKYFQSIKVSCQKNYFSDKILYLSIVLIMEDWFLESWWFTELPARFRQVNMNI